MGNHILRNLYKSVAYASMKLPLYTKSPPVYKLALTLDGIYARNVLLRKDIMPTKRSDFPMFYDKERSKN